MVLKKIKALLARRPKRGRPAETEASHTTTTVPAPLDPPAAATSGVPVHRGPEVVHHPVALQDLDPDAVRIVKRLTRFEYTAYLVGGCVRDLLLERKPKDFDIGTSATPRQIKRLFSNCRIIGRRFRLAHIYFQSGKIIEVATFRARDGAEGPPIDVPMAEGSDDDILIRDDNVFGTPEEDALRRDFTINALLYDVNAETVIDHADGLGDLRRKLVRTIGDPATRFREDPIRILRAIKFAARLDFAIEPKTLQALRATRVEIPKAAPPRVLEEFNRFCRSGAGRKSFELCFETGVFEIIVPELAAVYADDGPNRRALLALLDAIDVRWNSGREVGTGEIFTALLFAAVAPSLGWALNGAPVKTDRRDARTIIDDALRPIAVRLRISRKDQEHLRQTLTLLHRMAPPRPMRRGARQAMMRRPAFADALAMLDVLAPVLGGSFADGRTAWDEASAAGADAAHLHEPEHAAGERSLDDAEAPSGSRRRRGRRGGRRRRKTQEDTHAATPGGEAQRPPSASHAPKHPPQPQQLRMPRPAPERAGNLPPVWDDNYFFAALPSVPKTHTETSGDDVNRYGGGIVAPSVDDHENGETGAQAVANPSQRSRRRRRGGRGRRKGAPIVPTGGGSSPPEGGES